MRYGGTLLLTLLVVAAPSWIGLRAADEDAVEPASTSKTDAAFAVIERAIAERAKRAGSWGTIPGKDAKSAVSQLTVRDEFTDAQLLSMLQEQRKEAKMLDGGLMQYRNEAGSMILVRNIGKGGVQFRFAATGGKWSKASMNVWNRERRPTKAYLDKDNDPVLELDVLTSGGVTLEIVRQNTDLFDDALANFRDHLKTTNQK